MNCPKCGTWALIIETRKKPDHTRRRYECGNLHRFTTSEVPVPDAQMHKSDPKKLIAAIKEAAKFNVK